jgi:hypothetical protein
MPGASQGLDPATGYVARKTRKHDWRARRLSIFLKVCDVRGGGMEAGECTLQQRTSRGNHRVPTGPSNLGMARERRHGRRRLGVVREKHGNIHHYTRVFLCSGCGLPACIGYTASIQGLSTGLHPLFSHPGRQMLLGPRPSVTVTLEEAWKVTPEEAWRVSVSEEA